MILLGCNWHSYYMTVFHRGWLCTYHISVFSDVTVHRQDRHLLRHRQHLRRVRLTRKMILLSVQMTPPFAHRQRTPSFRHLTRRRHILWTVTNMMNHPSQRQDRNLTGHPEQIMEHLSSCRKWYRTLRQIINANYLTTISNAVVNNIYPRINIGCNTLYIVVLSKTVW